MEKTLSIKGHLELENSAKSDSELEILYRKESVTLKSLPIYTLKLRYQNVTYLLVLKVRRKCCFIYMVKKITLFFFRSFFFRLTVKLRGKYWDLSYIPYSHTYMVSSLINISHHGAIFVTINKPTLAYHYHPKSIVNIFVHSCTFYGFGRM